MVALELLGHDIAVRAAQDDGPSNRGPYALSRSIAMVVLATLAVALRFYCRKLREAKYGLDDWVLLLALVVAYGVASCNFAEVAYGLGQHAADLSQDTKARFFMSLYVMEWFYVTSVTTTKFALLLLYLRIFATSDRFRAAVYCLGASVVVWALTLYLVLVFQCAPVRAAWQPWLAGARCLSIKWIQVGNAVPNITTDLVILALPATQIQKLQVGVMQKVSLCIAFALGGFVIIASAVRLYVLITKMDLNDATCKSPCHPTSPAAHTPADMQPTKGSFLEPCTWCVIELTSGVISVCLPTFWPLLLRASKTASRYFPSLYSGSSAGSCSSSPRGHDSHNNNNNNIVTIGGGGARRNNHRQHRTPDFDSCKSSDVLGLTSNDLTMARLSSNDDDSRHYWKSSE